MVSQPSVVDLARLGWLQLARAQLYDLLVSTQYIRTDAESVFILMYTTRHMGPGGGDVYCVGPVCWPLF